MQASPATLATEAATQPAQSDLKAQPAVLHATIEVIRAGTGKKEVFHLVGTPVVEPEQK